MPSDRRLNLAAGPLRTRVTLRRYTEAADSFGQSNKTWADVATLWARVEPLSGRELVQYAQLAARQVRAVTVRHRDDGAGGDGITVADRLTLGSKALEIVEVTKPAEVAKLFRLITAELPPGS
jgi:SPP1 family predicted phage head-tail adaptor